LKGKNKPPKEAVSFAAAPQTGAAPQRKFHKKYSVISHIHQSRLRCLKSAETRADARFQAYELAPQPAGFGRNFRSGRYDFDGAIPGNCEISL
jgi:hypothetical protein